jgi:hypothetical protein
VRTFALGASGAMTLAVWGGDAWAQRAEPLPDSPVPIVLQPPEGQAREDAPPSPEAIGEAPLPRPRYRGIVLASTLGVLGFGGRFRHVAPPAYWLQSQLGVEIGWLMIFGDAEVALTDTSESLDESQSMAFAMWGFGGGARATIHATERVALYGQLEVGALTADVPHNSLVILGFHHAETLNPTYGCRLGVEWYQVDRHLALFVALGGRLAEGFAKSVGPSDIPLVWDAGVGVRYTF